MNKPSDSKRAGEAPYQTLHRAVLTRRIALIAAGGVACLGATHRATAQAAKRRVAYLAFSSPNNPFLAQLRSGLRELGWIEGNNLTLDVRYAHGDVTQFVPLTVQLLALEPDVCVVSADFMAEAVVAATKTVPIVFIVGTEPVRRGLVKSLAKPGGNVTGFSTLDVELYPKRLALLKEAIPSLTTVGVIVGSRDRFGLDELEDARRRLGLELLPAAIDRPEDVDAAFDKFAKAGLKGVLDFSAGGATLLAREQVAALGIKHRIAIFGTAAVADSGVLMTYGYDIAALFKRAASLVDRILKGAKPADIPVEQVNTYEFVVNLRTARALGIELPRSLMLQATRVIA